MTVTRTAPHMMTLILIAGLAISTTNVIVPSLLMIARDFDAPYALMSIAFGGYLAVTAIVQLFAGPLSDRFGRRPVLLVALGVFSVASLGCALAQSVEVFLFFRLMQASVITGAALAMVVVRDLYGTREAASRIGYISAATAIAPLIGPMLGGILADTLGWQSMFWAFAGIGVVLVAVLWFDLGETNAAPSKTVLEQFRQYPDLIGSRRFWGYAICSSSSVSGFFIFLASAPIVANALMGLSQTQLGIMIGTITVGFVTGTIITGRLAKRVALIRLMIAGRISTLFGATLGFALVFSDLLTPLTLAASVVFVGFGNGLTIPSSNIGVMSVRPQIAGSAAGFSGALIVATGAFVSLIAAAIITPEAGAFRMYAMIMISGVVGMCAALYVGHMDKLRAGETLA